MPSIAILTWQNQRSDQLNEIENAHRAVGGSGRGRRYATRQINHAYAVLLSAQFQGYCRQLHSECADFLVGQIGSLAIRKIFASNLLLHRKLDSGNPNPGNIGSDFNRFGFELWKAVEAFDPQTERRREALEDLNRWRNAIAHQVFDAAKLRKSVLLLRDVRSWRTDCDGLAISFDGAMERLLFENTGTNPW